VKLAEIGLRGNGHMMMMEKNSDAIAEVILQWLAKDVPAAEDPRQATPRLRQARGRAPLNATARRRTPPWTQREPPHTRRRKVLATAAAFAVGLASSAFDPAQAAGKLGGQIAPTAEGAMEGVVVSAKKAGSTITISVVSDAQGSFSFPTAKLEPGQYTLRIR